MDSNQLRPTTSRHSLRKTPKVGPAHHNKSYITVVLKQIQMALLDDCTLSMGNKELHYQQSVNYMM